MPARTLSYYTTYLKGLVMPSSVIANMYYDRDTSILRIIYLSGNIYDYKKVPAVVYEEMKLAPSKGTFLNKCIKGKYDFEKVN